METIVKNICLETSKNRIYGYTMPSLDPETLKKCDGDCWGKYPFDVIIESGDTYDIFLIKDNLQLYFDGEHYIFRFSGISRLNKWLNNFVKATKFYKLCLRYGILKWVEIEYDFYKDDELKIYSELPLLTGNKFLESSVICVNEDAETFNGKFRLEGDTTRYEKNFVNFFNSVTKGKNEYEFKPPYINLNLHIDSDTRTTGDLISDFQEWVANKKYFIGDIVYHEDKYYVLEYGDSYSKCTVNGELYNYINECFVSGGEEYAFFESSVPKNLRNLDPNKISVKFYEDKNKVIQYDFIIPFYRGNYDSDTKITSFDDDNIENKHWYEISGIKNSLKSDENKYAYLTSRISDFRSVNKTYDDNSKLLPFNYNSEFGMTSLIYAFGYRNYSAKDNGICVDYFPKVELLVNKDDTSGKEYNFDDPTDPFIYIDTDDTNYKYIRFTYYIGCSIDEDNNVDLDSGLKYVETHEFSFKNAKYTIDGIERDISYVELVEKPEECNEGLAKVEYKQENTDIYPLHVFADDKLFGHAIIDKNDFSTTITRGTYASFERHNILSEVNSMDDLENYRNNYFNI